MHDRRRMVIRIALAVCMAAAYAVAAPSLQIQAQIPAQWTLEHDVAYGTTSDAPLTRVTRLTGRASGEAYVLDVMDPSVLSFDSRGAHVGRIGGAGEGPGEFRSRAGIGLIADTLWVLDAALRRLTFFGPGAVSPRTADVPSLQARMVLPLAALEGGANLVVAGPALDRLNLQIIDAEARALAQIPIEWGNRNLVVRVGPLERALTNPFSSGMLVGVAGDSRHFAIVDQPRPTSEAAVYVVRVLDARGDIVWSRNIAYRPESIPRRELDEWLEEINTEGPEARGISRRSILEAVRDSIGDIKSRPPVHARGTGLLQSVLVEADGVRVWVRRQPSVWEVVGRDGKEAIVRMPDGVNLLHVAGDYLWGVATDEYDVPRIHRFRLRRG